MTNPSNPSVDGAESAGGALQRLARAIRDSEFIRSGAVVDGHTITLREYAALAEAAKEALAALSSPRTPQEGESLAGAVAYGEPEAEQDDGEVTIRAFSLDKTAVVSFVVRPDHVLKITTRLGGAPVTERFALSPRDAPGEAQDTHDLGAANTLQGAQGGPASSAPETTGYQQDLSEPRPARATGEWADVWNRPGHTGSEPVGSSALAQPNSGANEDRERAAGAEAPVRRISFQEAKALGEGKFWTVDENECGPLGYFTREPPTSPGERSSDGEGR